MFRGCQIRCRSRIYLLQNMERNSTWLHLSSVLILGSSTKQSSPLSPVSNGANPTINMNNKQGSHNLQASSTVSNMSQVTSNKIEPSIRKHNAGSSNDGNMETTQASDVLERARAAIASAERATAELVNVKFGSYKLGEGKS
ncbi:hypothetical protein DKX38_015733 [Salix brachista]|uniref:Uncharacterized protein n=1 Tax=Salix brachista TaxID=2182728 RepID=A0A5N5L6E3_9ROSI|nr:hypothetical protein DKX38_015733 [Salix brachista]